MGKIKTSLIALLLTNILTIILAIYEKWDFMTILWIYWSQSIIIGFFNVIKILTLKNYSTDGFKINGNSVGPTENIKIFVAGFFSFHFGFFHFVYFIFLLTGTLGMAISQGKLISISAILISAVFYFVNHLFSFLTNLKQDSKKQENIGSVMFFPYLRIIPMHLTIIFGFLLGNGLLLFMILKTIADVIMHNIEHRDG